MKVPFAVRALPPVANKVWWTPPRSKKLSLGQVTAESGFDPISVTASGRQINGFRSGEGPVVFLIHGWGGQAAQMAPLARFFAESGYTAVSLDLPGHGGDSQITSDAFQMAEAIKALIDEYGEPQAVVAHSLGTIVTQIAFEAGLPEKVVLIAPLLDGEKAVEGFVDQARLYPWTARRLHTVFKRFVGESWWPRMTRGPEVDLGEGEILVIHDVSDRQTSFDMSAAFVARRPDTHLHSTNGLGHGRILSDPGVLKSVAGFVGTHREVSV